MFSNLLLDPGKIGQGNLFLEKDSNDAYRFNIPLNQCASYGNPVFAKMTKYGWLPEKPRENAKLESLFEEVKSTKNCSFIFGGKALPIICYDEYSEGLPSSMCFSIFASFLKHQLSEPGVEKFLRYYRPEYMSFLTHILLSALKAYDHLEFPQDKEAASINEKKTEDASPVSVKKDHETEPLKNVDSFLMGDGSKVIFTANYTDNTLILTARIDDFTCSNIKTETSYTLNGYLECKMTLRESKESSGFLIDLYSNNAEMTACCLGYPNDEILISILELHLILGAAEMDFHRELALAYQQKNLLKTPEKKEDSRQEHLESKVKAAKSDNGLFRFFESFCALQQMRLSIEDRDIIKVTEDNEKAHQLLEEERAMSSNLYQSHVQFGKWFAARMSLAHCYTPAPEVDDQVKSIKPGRLLAD